MLATGTAATTFAVREQRVADERQHARRLTDQLTRVQSVLAAPDATARRVPVAGGGQLAAVYSPALDAAFVLCTDLKRPDGASAYHVWVIRGDRAAHAGTLPAGQNGGTLLISGLRGANAVATSQEPTAGAASPTARAATLTLA